MQNIKILKRQNIKFRNKPKNESNYYVSKKIDSKFDFAHCIYLHVFDYNVEKKN